jgi:hypothetical protein
VCTIVCAWETRGGFCTYLNFIANFLFIFQALILPKFRSDFRLCLGQRPQILIKHFFCYSVEPSVQVQNCSSLRHLVFNSAYFSLLFFAQFSKQMREKVLESGRPPSACAMHAKGCPIFIVSSLASEETRHFYFLINLICRFWASNFTQKPFSMIPKIIF